MGSGTHPGHLVALIGDLVCSTGVRKLFCLAFTLLIATPASASTLDYADDAYRWQGTPERDVLVMSGDAASVTFTDVEGSLTTGELPEGCASAAVNAVRCTQLPRKLTVIDGAAGDDELVGSRFDELVLGGDGNDRLRAGAGADNVQGGAGHDTLDFSRDGREVGVIITDGSGPDSGDSFDAQFERFIGTRFADSFTLLDRRGAHEIETLGGRDFVDTAESYGARSPGDRIECGPGVDLYRVSYTDDDVIGCEEAGSGLGEPTAGHVLVTYPARYLPGRALAFAGTAECRAGGARCTLIISVNGFGRTVRRIRPGGGAPLTHVMSRHAYVRAREKGKAVRRVRFVLRKEGFPEAWAQLSRDIAP